MPVETPNVGEALGDVGSSSWTAGFGEGGHRMTEENTASACWPCHLTVTMLGQAWADVV